MNEIYDATHRISRLVDAAKQYTQVDRAAHQFVVVEEGLDSTLIMLGRKLKTGSITVEKDLAPICRRCPAYPGELNQVWTNLIDNALQAMPDGGTLRIRTAREDDCVLVEIGDSGSGHPARAAGQDLRALLHHQAGGRGHRTGARHLLPRHHPAPRR